MIAKLLIRGAIAGLRATVPMTGVMKLGFSLLPRKEQYPLPPRQITTKVADVAGVREELTERQKTILTLISHFAYGTTMGIAYSLIVGRRRSTRGSGAAFGLVVWIGSYLGWLPALGILKPATEHPVRRNVLMIIAHLVWGTTVGSLVRSAQRRDYQFKNRVVVIMGGSRGLGLELARRWTEEGATVAFCARTKRDLQRAHKELQDQGGDVLSAVCDITSKDDVDSFIQQVIDRWGRIDVLVNNAGVIQVGPMDCMSEEDYRLSMDTHYWGPRYAINAALPSMRRQGGGRIVNISSIGGKISIPHLLPYSASKFALAGYSEGLSAELQQGDVLVTTVYPGLMRTGGPSNALFKGQHRKEYAWFSISDSVPLISIGSARAAHQIVEACRSGVSRLEITPFCKVAVRFHATFPRFTDTILAVMHFCLPSPGGIGMQSKTGKESTSVWSPSLLTGLTDRAARRNNEVNANGASRRK